MAGETILLVDDEMNIVQLARLYLEREGYKVIFSGDGLDALAQTQTTRPDLLVLDLMLPGLDGLEVCKRLRGEKNPVAIIMLTARDEDIDKIIGLEMGADDYMTSSGSTRANWWRGFKQCCGAAVRNRGKRRPSACCWVTWQLTPPAEK